MKKLKKYLLKRQGAIKMLLDKPNHDFTPESFHQLRVEIKKMLALGHLLNACSDKFRLKKTYKPLQQLSDLAGDVRELQLEHNMLRKYVFANPIRNYKRKLKGKVSESEQGFFSKVNKAFIKKLNKKYKKITTRLNDIHKKNANQYLSKQRKKLIALLEPDTIPAEQVHVLRKLLKAYTYTNKSLDSTDEVMASPKLKLLMSVLGKWHDGRVIIRHLEKVIHTFAKNPKEVSKLVNIKNQVIARTEKLLSKTDDLRHAFLLLLN